MLLFVFTALVIVSSSTSSSDVDLVHHRIDKTNLVGGSLLLIGDSVDRFITVEWCEEFHGEGVAESKLKKVSNMWAITSPWVKTWVDDEITDKDDPYFQCINHWNNNDSITNVHMLGSAANGPYYKDNENLEGNLYRDSQKRIDKTLELYVNRYGIPDKIMFHTILWDVIGIIERIGSSGQNDKFFSGSELFNQSLSLFRSNYIQRVDQIQAYFNSLRHIHNESHYGKTSMGHLHSYRTADQSIIERPYPIGNRAKRHSRADMHPLLGLRTAVWVSAGGDLLQRCNQVVRDLSKERSIPLYDFDKEVWAVLDFQYTAKNEKQLLRDWIHPHAEYTIQAAQTMLRRRESQYYYPDGYK